MKKLYWLMGLLIATSPVIAESTSHVQKVVEEHGYVYNGLSGVKTLASGVHIVSVLSRSKDDNTLQSAMATIKGDDLQLIDKPKWAGWGGYIQLLDINDDGLEDIVGGTYYEPEILIRVFFNAGNDKFKKVFEGNSVLKPIFSDEYIGNDAKGLIINQDERGEGIPIDFALDLYLYNGKEYVFKERTAAIPKYP